MRKHIVFAIALVMAAQVVWAATVTKPEHIPDYWSSVDGKSGAALWTAISSQTNKGYSSIGYKGLYTAYKQTDVYPKDSVGKAGKIWDMYGECMFATSNTCGNYSGVCDCYNREHSIPQSWWGGGTNGIGNDIFHVLPTDGKVNGVRSNYEYGEVNGGTNWVGNKFGSAGTWSTDKKTIASEAGETVKGTGNVFEPKPYYKGDIARGLLGTIVKWQQSNLTSGNNFFNGKYDASNNFGLTKKAVVLLMKWHREDPVSQKEIDRNNGIQATQGNRNPFIDYPYLAEYIWGEHYGETVDMSKLMASTDPEFIPGKSDGSREGSTPVDPPTPTEKYTVTWSANGEELFSAEMAKGDKIPFLPKAPESCSSESTEFMGWTDMPISGTTDDEPAPLYTKATEIPAVTEDVTYYAVYAQVTEGEGWTPESYNYAIDNLTDGWTNTATNKGSYWLLESGKTITSPEIDLARLEKITVKMRTYGGTQNDKLDVHEESGKLTSIIATEGSSMTEYEWINNLYIAGNSALTFSSDYGSGKGIGIASITLETRGATANYDRYITSCQGTTEVVAVQTEAPAKKMLIGGELYIFVGEQLYTLQGQRVK